MLGSEGVNWNWRVGDWETGRATGGVKGRKKERGKWSEGEGGILEAYGLGTLRSYVFVIETIWSNETFYPLRVRRTLVIQVVSTVSHETECRTKASLSFNQHVERWP